MADAPKPIPESHRDLVDRPIVAALGTTLPNGTPQVTPVWFHYEDGYIYFNTAAGRLKDRAIRANPYVAVMILDPNDGYRYVQLRGPVVEITEQGARAHIDQLARRYTGAEYFNAPPSQVRIKYKMRPEFVDTMG